jgi:ribonuclease P protein component
VKPWLPLSSQKEFVRILKEGKRAEGEFLYLRLLPGGDKRKAGFSTQGGFEKAVCRNRAKRWMREALTKHLFLVPEGAGVILVAKPGIQASDFSRIQAEVGRLLRECS